MARVQALPLTGGHDAGPLFAHGPSLRVARRKNARQSGGKEVWAKYKRTKPSAHDNAVFRALQDLGRIYSAFTGERYSVDHIVPLNGGIVSGLHRACNFEVLPLAANVRKGARWWPDMPESQQELPL